MGIGTSRRASVSDTSDWQLALLPSAPQYCTATPGEAVPFFGSAVSSITSIASGPPTKRSACSASTVTAHAFLDALVAGVPYGIEIVLADNGIQFADLPQNRSGPTAMWRGHPFDRACQAHGIEHRLTKPRHPWTNGQVERMSRPIKEATVKRFHYGGHDQLRARLESFVAACNFVRRLKTLKGLTPYEFIRKRWTIEPERFIINPIHQIPGLNTYLSRLLPLGFLAPDIVTAILRGGQPVGLTAEKLIRASKLPLDWDGQWQALGFGSAAL